MKPTFDIAAYHLTQVHRFAGTITDISEIGRIEPDKGPAISPAALQWIRAGIQNGVWSKSQDGKTVFVRDGKKILNFVQAYHLKQQAICQNEANKIEQESEWLLCKLFVRLIVTKGHAIAAKKVYEMADYQLTETDWQWITENGCGFMRRMVNENTSDDLKQYVSAYADARDNMAEHLERLWLELFERHGMAGAKEWVRVNLVPDSEEAKAAINQAYLNAKQELKNKTHAPSI